MELFKENSKLPNAINYLHINNPPYIFNKVLNTPLFFFFFFFHTPLQKLLIIGYLLKWGTS